MNGERNALVGYAVLRANYNAAHPTTYLESFTKFIVDVLARRQSDWHTYGEVAAELRKDFKLTIPDAVVAKVLKKAAIKSLVEVDRGSPVRYRLASAGQSQVHSITADIARFERQQAELVSKYRSFVADNFHTHTELLNVDLAEQLADYLESHAIPLLGQAVHGRNPAVDKASDESGIDYVTAKFIATLAASDVAGFAAVEDAAKGAVLAAVVTLDTGRFSQSLGSLVIYLDTPFLIKLLGFDGEHGHAAAMQLVDMSIRQGATVAAFEHSVRELRGVLQQSEQVVRYPTRPGTLIRGIDLHFLNTGATPADVVIVREGLPEALKKVQVEIRPTPDDYHRYGLDEPALETLLQKRIGYRSESTRLYDVRSLSAIHRLRRGSTSDQLETSRAIFVTDNLDLARAALEVEEHTGWPLAVLDGELASILWARSPAMAEDLPRTQIIATAYAGMQPDGRLWTRYLEEIEKLEARGTIAPEEAIVLRSTYQARENLMAETLGLVADVTAETPGEVLAKLRAETAAPFEEDLRQARERAKAVEDELQRTAGSRRNLEQQVAELQRLRGESEAIEERRRSRIGERAAKHGQVVANWIRWPMIIIVALSVAVWVLGHLVPDVIPRGWAVASGVSAVVIGLLGVLPGIFGGSIVNWLHRFEQRVTNNRRNKLLADAGYES